MKRGDLFYGMHYTKCVRYTNNTISKSVIVNCVVFSMIDNILHALLTRSNFTQSPDLWVLPADYCLSNESTIDTLHRILDESVHINRGDELNYTEQLYTFDVTTPTNPLPSIAVSYMSIGNSIDRHKLPGHVTFFPVTSLPTTHAVHRQIITYAYERLQSKLLYTNISFALLPPNFTLNELQTLYESILTRQFDKRNFRKKILDLGLLTETGRTRQAPSRRPAKLFQMREPSLSILNRQIV